MLDLIIVAALIIVAILSAAFLAWPPTSLALIATACGILLTWRATRAQRSLAERKLFLDLMPRRAEWYERVKLALNLRVNERREQVEAILGGNEPDNPQHLMMLHQLETEASWLFGDDMVALMALTIAADIRISEHMLAARYGDREAAFRLGSMQTDLYKAQGTLQEYLIHFLYVGDIGKPKRSPVVFAKTPR